MKIAKIHIGYFLIVFLLMHCIQSNAQTIDSLPYSAELSSTGTYNKTNGTSSYLFSNSLNASAKRKYTQLNLQTKWLYGAQQAALVNNDFFGTLDLDVYKTSRPVYYWALCSYNSAFSLKINHQFQSGLGIAYNIIDRVHMLLNVSDGVLYDYSDIYNDEDIHEIYEVPRNSFRLKLKILLENRLTFSSISYVQHSLLDQTDFIIKNENNLLFELKEWLSINLKMTYDRMSRTGKEAIYITYGLLLKKSF